MFEVWARILNHMVENVAEMDSVFHALASGARRSMISRLVDQELTVSQLAEPFAMSLAAASKHIQVLERAGIVRRTVAGRRHICSLEPERLAAASVWLRFYEQHWEHSLDTLENLFSQDPPEGADR
jgi:DNA-binding transcriptional ArsR family regulator